ncbi:MAG: hypothetical protein AB7Q64_24110 [Verrucomicrobiales bacterium]
MDELLDNTLSFEILFRDGTKLVVELFSSLFLAHPVDSVEALLEDIFGTRLEIGKLPWAEFVAGLSGRISVVPAKRRNLGPIFHSIDRVSQIWILTTSTGPDRAQRGGFEFLNTYP